jgi:hypothetical protein
MKMYVGVEVQLHTLTSKLHGGEWSVSRTGRFTPGESPRYPLDRKLGGSQDQPGCGDEEKKSQPLSGIELPLTKVDNF